MRLIHRSKTRYGDGYFQNYYFALLEDNDKYYKEIRYVDHSIEGPRTWRNLWGMTAPRKEWVVSTEIWEITKEESNSFLHEQNYDDGCPTHPAF